MSSLRYKSNAMVGQLLNFLTFNTVFLKRGKLLGEMILYNNRVWSLNFIFTQHMVVKIYCSLEHRVLPEVLTHH